MRPARRQSIADRARRWIVSPVVRAIAVFTLIAGAWFLSMPQPWFRTHLWDPFTTVVAYSAGAVFRVFGSDVLISGTTLTVDGTTLQIDFGCNGLEAHGLFIAAMIAAGVSWKRKLWGLLFGTVGIFVINLLRVCGLFVAAGINRELFEFGHLIVGQTLVIVATMALLLWWCREPNAETKSA